jgi:hypothetical protein
MAHSAKLVIKGTATAKVYGVRFSGSKKIVWCRDYSEAARKLKAIKRPEK